MKKEMIVIFLSILVGFALTGGVIDALDELEYQKETGGGTGGFTYGEAHGLHKH
jgi:hypothetical protein